MLCANKLKYNSKCRSNTNLDFASSRLLRRKSIGEMIFFHIFLQNISITEQHALLELK